MVAFREAGSEWSKLVTYLRACVGLEAAAKPVQWKDRDRWATLPLNSETVLSGDDLTLDAHSELEQLFHGLEEMEGVFYGWPLILLEDERKQPWVAPLLLRALAEPDPGEEAVPVQNSLPMVNPALLTPEWFAPEVLAEATGIVTKQKIAYGLAEGLSTSVSVILEALGLPAELLDPTTLLLPWSGEPYYPQQVGAYNLAMAFRGKLDSSTWSLCHDLDWMIQADDWGEGAARFLFEDVPGDIPALPQASVVPLNARQEQALASAATNPLTVLTGPPGTGKSQTVTAIIAEAWLRGESVVLASTNNTPVDDVVRKAQEIEPALALRTGNQDKRRELAGRLRELPMRTAPAADGRVGDLQSTGWAVHRAGRTLEVQADREAELFRAAQDRERWRAQVWDGAVPDKNAEAVLSSRAARGLRTRWAWLRRRRAKKLRAQVGIPASVPVQQIVEWVGSELDLEQARRSYEEFQTEHRNALEDFQRAREGWQATSIAATKTRVREAVARGTEELNRLAVALGDSKGLRPAMSAAMRFVKGWATSTMSVRPSFDCAAGTIDLVIIDEAGQCNLAQVLPLAYRAKRLVIVGDEKQLPPVVTTNEKAIEAQATAAGLDPEQLRMRNLTFGVSAFSAFAARKRPMLLDEHYRCHPQIIGFCNQYFYNNELTVLTAVSDDDPYAGGLEWIDVEGAAEPGPTGSVRNRAEAEAIVEWISQSGVPGDRLGVVTPFRAQATLLRALLTQRGLLQGSERPRVGTAHTFQGGEQHTMLFSTVISAGAKPGTVNWLEGQRNLINVAVSRARHRLVVFGHRAELERLRAATLLALADAAATEPRSLTATSTEPVRRLHAALIEQAIPARLGETVEGYELAITVRVRDRQINIEVSDLPADDPRGRRQRQLATRDNNLRALGWQVHRVPAWEAYLEPGTAARRLSRVFLIECGSS